MGTIVSRKYAPFIIEDGGIQGNATPHQVRVERGGYVGTNAPFVATTANLTDALVIAEALQRTGAHSHSTSILAEGIIT